MNRAAIADVGGVETVLDAMSQIGRNALCALRNLSLEAAGRRAIASHGGIDHVLGIVRYGPWDWS